MSIDLFEKDPDSVLDYTLDWSPFIGSDTISTSNWPSFPAGITLASQSNTPTSATAWLSGGTLGKRYTLLNRITTAGGRTMDWTIYVKIVQK